MKKILYILIALIVLGGLAFGLTQMDFLKGMFGQIKSEEVRTLPSSSLEALIEDSSGSLGSDVEEEIRDLGGSTMDVPEIEAPEAEISVDTDGDGLPDNVSSGAVDLSLNSLSFDSTTLTLNPEICLTGALDAVPQLSLYYVVTQEDSILTEDDTSIMSSDLTADACTTVNVDASSDLTNLVEGTMLVTMIVDSTGEASESDEDNNLIQESFEIAAEGEEDDTGQTSETTYACSAINIDPDTYTLTGSEDVAITVTATVEEKIAETSFWDRVIDFLAGILSDARFYMAFSLPEVETYWQDVLIVESSGSGTLTDENGKSGTSLEIQLFWNVQKSRLSTTLSYSGGAAGDILTAYLKDEPDCKDQLTLEEAAPTDTDGDGLTDEEETALGTEPLDTDSDDGSINDGDEVTAGTNPLDSSDDVTTTDTTTTDITTDTSTTDTSEITTTTGETSASTSTSTGPKTKPDLNTILTAEDFSCDEPFEDVEKIDWFWGYVCRAFMRNIVDGRDSDSFVGGDEMTRAEAIKVLMLLSGHDVDEAEGNTEGFADVSEGDWYYPYVVIAQDEDVARVRDSSVFNPNTAITRGDFMLFMVRTAGQTIYNWTEDDIPFSDLDANDYYTYALLIGYNTWVDDPEEGTIRVFEGYEDGTSGADEYINRAEAMALALRFYLAWYAE